MISRLLKIWFGVLCASLLCTWGIVWIMHVTGKDFTVDPDQTAWMGILSVWYSLAVALLSVGSATLLLNRSKRVRDNRWLRPLSFFLAPLLIAVAGLSQADDRGEFIVWLPVLCPFAVSLSAAYVWFSRKLDKGTDD
jgi:hypothetical protein